MDYISHLAKIKNNISIYHHSIQSFINGCELSQITPSVKNIYKENIFFGPVNYIQLIGTINNIQKKITLFLDTHLDLNNQTRCPSFDKIIYEQT